MKPNRILIAMAVALTGWACGPSAPSQPKTYVDAKRGIRFEYPGKWAVEELREENVLLVSCPEEERNWQANVFIELRNGFNQAQTPEQRLAELIANLQQQKSNFALQSSRAFAHASGVPAGELIYTHTGGGGVPLTEKEIILWFSDGRALFATGSAVTGLWSKYDAPLGTVFDSLRPIGH